MTQDADRLLQGLDGFLQVDGHAGYDRLIADRIGPGIQAVISRVHARRKLIEITRTGPAPIAEEGIALTAFILRRGLDPSARPTGASGPGA